MKMLSGQLHGETIKDEGFSFTYTEQICTTRLDDYFGL